ncbi:MAG: RagB/SusD family nutrient uptake outer membrane protein [Gemmatimonadota bacterium]
MRTHRSFIRLTSVAATLMLVACKESLVPNYNSPNVDQLTNGRAAGVNTTVLGLLVGERASVGTNATVLGILGREVYNLDGAEPRNVLGYLVGPLEPGGFGTDMGWSAAYRQLLTAFTILEAVDNVPDYTAQQREAVKGFTKTFMAMAYVNQLRIRDTFGIVLEVDPSAQNLGAFVTREEGYNRAATLLDEARTHLGAAGTAFPFQLTSGFAGFNTPTTFLRFNRAIKARMEAYRGRWSDVMTALNESFISTTATTVAALATGVYHVYSTASGDAVNPLFDPAPRALVAHQSFLADAQAQPGGAPDRRASSKAVVGNNLSTQGVSSNLRITAYASNVAGVPIIKNEELILLRAEAQFALGNRAAAIQDLNFVRVNSGGLAALPADYAGDLVTEILYNRRYSLFYEYGHRWVDMRRYGRLSQLPKALASHRVFPIVPLPLDECNQRDPRPKGCVQVSGS